MGRPRARSHFCAVRTLTPRWCAISFHDVSCRGPDDIGAVNASTKTSEMTTRKKRPIAGARRRRVRAHKTACQNRAVPAQRIMRTKIVPGIFACSLIPAVLLALTFSIFTTTLEAQDPTNSKAPYSMIYFEGGGGIVSPQHSSASVPTMPCPNGLISNLSHPCAEQFSRADAGLIGMGVRPIRYLQTGTTIGILGNVNGYNSVTAPYQCVSGCTGTVSETVNTTTSLITIDARGVLPLFHEHLLISAGGGVGWVEVRSHAATGSAQVQGGCPYCPSPQGGHGPTEVAEITYLPDRHFGIGLQFRNVGIHSSGLTAAAGPLLGGNVTYKDRFLLIGGVISFRFGAR
jgi:hypothetical protein